MLGESDGGETSRTSASPARPPFTVLVATRAATVADIGNHKPIFFSEPTVLDYGERQGFCDCDSCDATAPPFPDLVSQKVFIKLFCKSQFPHQSVNLSFIVTNMKDKLTNLCGN